MQKIKPKLSLNESNVYRLFFYLNRLKRTEGTVQVLVFRVHAVLETTLQPISAYHSLTAMYTQF